MGQSREFCNFSPIIISWLSAQRRLSNSILYDIYCMMLCLRSVLKVFPMILLEQLENLLAP